jgi:hypothetical protein
VVTDLANTKLKCFGASNKDHLAKDTGIPGSSDLKAGSSVPSYDSLVKFAVRVHDLDDHGKVGASWETEAFEPLTSRLLNAAYNVNGNRP